MLARLLLRCALALLAALGTTTARAAFTLDTLADRARKLATAPYQPPAATTNQALAALSYDDYRDIRYRPAASWWRDAGLPFELQFFHVGRGYDRPVQLHELVGGEARPLVVPKSAFDYGRGAPAMAGREQAEVAGFRIHYPLNTAAYKDEVLLFQGASYLRAVGAGQVYGLSARGLAVDTVGGSGEEFPAFRAFWIERPARDATALTVYALLDGPRVTGAYRFVVRPGSQTLVEVQARVFLRRGGAPIATLGIAPLTSMFLGGENQPQPLWQLGDFRPEVHDSDGLQIETAAGEWLWRPLVNPPRPFTTSFALQGVRGFGLMQRDRSFASYEDPEARYDRRPSVWVQPQGDWGPGRVELMQFHTPDETNDNVAAYWVPSRLPAPGSGEALALAYTLHWQGDAQRKPPAGWTAQSRYGRSHAAPASGEVQFNIDFDDVPDCAQTAGPQVHVTAGDNARVLLSNAYRHPRERSWRTTLKVQRRAPQEALELRAFLTCGADVLTETWTLALPPER